MAQAFEEKEGAVNSWFALSYCIIIQVVYLFSSIDYHTYVCTVLYVNRLQ
jgi:hypothetical protein